MIPINVRKQNIKLAFSKTRTLTTELLDAIVDLISSEGSSVMSAEQIRNSLSSLLGENRLDASSVKNISTNIVLTFGSETFTLQEIVSQLLFDVNQLSTVSHEHANKSILDSITASGDGSEYLNNAGEYSLIDWLSIVNQPTTFLPSPHEHEIVDITDFPTNVSHFSNNGDGSSPYDTVQSVTDKLLHKSTLPTGFISGLQLSINALDSTKFDISSGYYAITDYTNMHDAQTEIVQCPGFEAIEPTYLSSSIITYLALDINQTIIQSSTPFSNTDRRQYAILGAVIHSNLSVINVVNEIKAPIIDTANQLHDLMQVVGRLNISGNTYTANGTNLAIDKSSGAVFGFGINAQDYTNPHILNIAEQIALTFRYRLRDGTEYTDVSSINPNQYDNSGVLSTVNNNRFTIQHIVLFQSGLTRIQYGQHEYLNITEAEQSISTEDFDIEQNIATNSIFRSYLIVKKGCTALTNATEAKFIPVDKWGNTVTGGVSLTYDTITTALGYVPENVANKAEDFSVVNHTKYPTVQAVNTVKLDKIIQQTNVTIAAAGWSLVSGLYEYVHSDANITSTSIVDCIPNNDAISIVKVAEILPKTESSVGSVKLYATNLPSADFTVTFNIIKN